MQQSTTTDKTYSSLTAFAADLKKSPNPPELCSLYLTDAGAEETLKVRWPGKKIRPYYLKDGVPVQGLPRKYGRTLFRADQIAANPKAPILWVEGEKAAMCPLARALQEHGYIVTTNQGGSGAIKHSDWSILADRDVTIMPDNDEPGFKAAREIQQILPKARIIQPPAELREKGDIADLSWPVEEFIAYLETADALEEESTGSETQELYAHFLMAPSHGIAADILFHALGSTTIFERFNDRGGEFFTRDFGQCFYEPAHNMRHRARVVLEDAVNQALEIEKQTTDDIKGLYSAAGKALQKPRTKDFLASTLILFSERVTVEKLEWNQTPETLPTLTGILDFSGPEMMIRNPLPGEYFRDPLPYAAEQIVKGGDAPNFSRFLSDLFPNPETQLSALQCLSMLIANKPSKVFQVWQNDEGNGAKNTLVDVINGVTPGRIRYVNGATILTRADSGEKRFGVYILRGASAGVFDEVGGTFDIAAIKRLTNLSGVRAEAKGRDPVHIPQTWVLAALCNELPAFLPSDDQAFISRLFILPFYPVFYADEAERERYLNRGVAPQRLHPAREKEALLAEITPENPAILSSLINIHILMRESGLSRPQESPECARAKNEYRANNDKIEKFFDEYLKRQDGGRVEYSRLLELYHEYACNKKMTMRTLSTELKKRFKFLDTKPANGKRWLLNAVEKGTNDVLPF
ncbi:hypothetical protein [Marispirochaeta sp.]|uniref:hypothetical protein n=1 Tax=Marispirochaeta sp. TaxID=2038653 RepID=UPI0029C7F6C2|nr:hypothetical protein [Marispirochaeta sp.]